MPVGRVVYINKSLFKQKESRHPDEGRGPLLHSANYKYHGTQWIPACAGMTRVFNFSKYKYPDKLLLV